MAKYPVKEVTAYMFEDTFFSTKEEAHHSVLVRELMQFVVPARYSWVALMDSIVTNKKEVIEILSRYNDD
jgi:hypothetical protein